MHKFKPLFIALTLALICLLSACSITPVNKEQVSKTPVPTIYKVTATPTDQSLPQQGISLEESNKILPLMPATLTAEQHEGNVKLIWNGTGEDRVKMYEIYRNSNSSTWNYLAGVRSTGDNTGSYSWTDSTVSVDVEYTYGIRAITDSGSKSPLTSSTVIVIRRE